MKVIKTYPEYLGNYVKFFYSVHTTAFEQINATHRRLPDGTLDIVLNLGSPVLLSRDGINFSEMPEAALTGLYQDRKFLQYKGTVNLIGAVLQPGSAHLFVNDTLEQYKECVANASLIFGSAIYLLLEQLKYIPGEEEKHHLFECFLLHHLSGKNYDQYTSPIPSVIQQIHTTDGHIEMATLYKNYFMSERTFRRKFKECVGMSPKQYATIIRIKSFSKRYELSRATYADICNELGYTDQSHLNKDFQKIAGISPTSYFGQLNKIGEEFIHLI